MLPLIIGAEAEADLAHAYSWYDEQRLGLGDEFLAAVEACFDSLQRSPQSHAVVMEPIRRALTRRFPFGVFFVVEADAIHVLAVFHCSRDPRGWEKRGGP